MPDPYRIPIDGRWGLENLAEFPRTYSQVYSIIYSLESDRQETQADKRAIPYTAYPWIGGYSALNFYYGLYYLIPAEDRPRVASLRYSSPGHIDLFLWL